MPPISKTLSNLPIFSNYLKNVYIPVLEFESGVKLNFYMIKFHVNFVTINFIDVAFSIKKTTWNSIFT